MRPIVLLVLCAACGDGQVTAPPTATPEAAASPVAAPPPPGSSRESGRHPALDASSWREAFDLAKPQDIKEGGDNTGTFAFAFWAMTRMRWIDVDVPANETSFAKVRKDSEAERGKRICASGIMIEIEVRRTGGGVLHEGGLMIGSGDALKFIAAGDTGELVSGSTARFCGVVTGRHSYGNSAGGTTHGIRAVGMFDLPSNRKGAADGPKPSSTGTIIDVNAL